MANELTPMADHRMQEIKTLVLDSVNSPHSRRAYDRALTDFLAWRRENNVGDLTKATVQQFRRHLEQQGLSASTINVRMTAVRRMAAEAAKTSASSIQRRAPLPGLAFSSVTDTLSGKNSLS